MAEKPMSPHERAEKAALAHAAAMRRASTEYRHWFDTCTKTLADDWRDKAAAASDALDAALALSPGEALEKVRWEAQIEALEKVYAARDDKHGLAFVIGEMMDELRKGEE